MMFFYRDKRFVVVKKDCFLRFFAKQNALNKWRQIAYDCRLFFAGL